MRSIPHGPQLDIREAGRCSKSSTTVRLCPIIWGEHLCLSAVVNAATTVESRGGTLSGDPAPFERPDGTAEERPPPKRRKLGSVFTELFRWDGWAKVASIATTLVAVVALYFSGQSLIATRKQYGLSEQGQVTDRFARAVENLGSDKVNVRLGGIYALERLARDSVQDQPTIVEILSGFVRTQAPAAGPPCSVPDRIQPTRDTSNGVFSAPPVQPQVDVQAAITVIGRRDPHHDGATTPNPNDSCLTGLRVVGTFAGASFDRSKLHPTYFFGRDLRCTRFVGADLSGAYVNGVDLTRANLFNATAIATTFTGADMQGAILDQADFSSADFAGANLSTAHLDGTILTGARFRGGPRRGGLHFADAKLAEISYSGETRWPAGFDPPANTAIAVDGDLFETPKCLRDTNP